MASGKAIGEFSFKAITATHSPGPAGSVLNQVNWEGTATGFGAVFSTATYVGGPKNGTFSKIPTTLGPVGNAPNHLTTNTVALFLPRPAAWQPIAGLGSGTR